MISISTPLSSCLRSPTSRRMRSPEEQVFNLRAKLFKFVKETAEWKERGTGAYGC